METRTPPKLTPPTDAEIATAVRATRSLVKFVLILLGVVAFLVLEFGTDVAASIGGTPKQVGFGMAMLCIIPGVALYFPLAWATSAWVKSLLQRRRG